MTGLSKYVKQPLSSNLAQYTDVELRKIELIISNIGLDLLELQQMASANFQSGTFVGTLTGCTTSPTVTVAYARAGNIVVLLIPGIVATSNTTACTMTGLPNAIKPTSAQGLTPALVQNNSADGIGLAQVLSTGVIEFRPSGSFSETGFTASGQKGINRSILAYTVE